MLFQINKIINRIEKKYQHDKNVLGILVFGSFARDTADKFSDIDVYVLLKKKSKLAREGLKFDTKDIDIFYDSLKEVEEYLKVEKNSVKRITSHMIAHGTIIVDTNNILKKLQDKARNNLKLKTTITKNELIMHLYSLKDFIDESQRFFEKNNHYAFEKNAELFINNITELFLKINNEYLRRPNELPEVIKRFSPGMWKLLNQYYKAKTLKQRMNILKKLYLLLKRSKKLVLPISWKITHH